MPFESLEQIELEVGTTGLLSRNFHRVSTIETTPYFVCVYIIYIYTYTYIHIYI